MKNEFDPKVWNRLIYSKAHIATEIRAENVDNRKWVAIYPSDLEDYLFKIFEIELPKEIIENELDWFDDDEIKYKRYVKSEAELFYWLTEMDIKQSAFTTPWACQYPYH